ncbi:amino acid adenylation domain-containing protein [candidate division KSB1 bacterium]|nr:amino acid adenylation domain-containing protein [candidate division KSB1 bacterium]
MNKDKPNRYADLSPEQKRQLQQKALEKRLQIRQRQEIPKRANPGHAPVSMAQKRLYILYQLQPESVVYHISNRLEIEGTFNVEFFKKSVDILIKRHEILRTTFHREGKAINQMIHSDSTSYFQVVDLQNTPRAYKKHVEHAKASIVSPFELDRGPLMRVIVYRLQADHTLLLFVFHHIICDGVSMDILVRELMTCYTAFYHQKSPRLSPLKIQYGDFAEWQQHRLQQPQFTEKKQFWLQRLANIPDILPVPTDYDYPAEQPFDSDVVNAQLDVDTLTRLEHIACRNNVSLYMILLAAFAYLVHRITNQSRFVLGTPVGSREHPDLEPLMGFFVNTLALVMNIDIHLPFSDWLAVVRQESLEAFKHQHVPFDWLVEHIQPSRLPNRPPLVQVLFVMQNMRIKSPKIPNANITLLEELFHRCGFEWIAVCQKKPAGLLLGFEYPTNLFSRATMQTWLAAYKRILLQIIDNEHLPLDKIELLDPGDIENHVNSLPPAQRMDVQTIPQAIPHSDRLALMHPFGHYTFAQLHHHSDRLARTLCSAIEAESGMRIAVMMPKCPQAVIAAVGIMKAGGVYVPILHGHPKERIRFMLEDSQCRALLTLTDFEHRCKEYGVPVIAIDSLEDSDTANRYPCPKVSPQHLAYIIYTSGTTGQPKGVEVEHGGFVTMAQDSIALLGLTPDDRVLWFFSPAFDGSLFEIFTTLFCGACLVIPEPSRVLDPELFINMIETRKISVAALPPTFIQSVGFRALKSLRLLISAGEQAVPLLDPERPEKSYWNLYGPTEVSVTATARPIRYSDAENTGKYLGHPLPHIGISILYAFSDRLQPVHAIGEICISGIQVARGYQNHPELTGQVFMQHPYGPAHRLYRTGDMGRMLHDGSIEFIGRKDDQLKIRGYRIEPREIEHVILQAANIERVAVVLHTLSRILVAFVVGEEIDFNDLDHRLRSELPRYMVPAQIQKIDVMPKTANGKTDYAILKKWPLQRRETPIVLPRDDREDMLRTLWAELLDHDRFGIHDSFFDLGGDSIKAIQMLSHIRKQGFSVRARDIYRFPTIAQLAENLDDIDQSFENASEPQTSFPLTPVQAWFFDFVVTGRDQFLQKSTLYSSERIDFNALQTAIETIAKRYDSLRLRFDTEQNRQYYSPDSRFPMEFVDCISTPVDVQAKELKLQSRIGLDNNTSLLLAIVYRFDSHDLVRLVFHHLIIDAVSLRFVIEDLNMLYAGYLDKKPVSLPPTTASYRAWTDTLHEYAQSTALKNQIDYWRAIETNIEPILPVENKTVKNVHDGEQTLVCALSKENSQRLSSLSGTRMSGLLVTSCGYALSNWTGRKTFVLTMVSHGREMAKSDVDVSRTTGWFTCFYPFAFSLQETPFRTLQVVSDQLARVPNNGIGYGLLKFIKRELGDAQAEISLNYLGKFMTSTSEGKYTLKPVAAPEKQLYGPYQKRNAELELACLFVDRTLSLYAVIQPQRLNEEEVRAFLQRWAKEIEVILDIINI